MLTYAAAKVKRDLMNAIAKAYWADKKIHGRFSCENFAKIRKEDPGAPSDGYWIYHKSGLSADERELGQVSFTHANVLAGDGFVRDEHNQIIYATQEQLDSEEWKVVEQDYALW